MNLNTISNNFGSYFSTLIVFVFPVAICLSIGLSSVLIGLSALFILLNVRRITRFSLLEISYLLFYLIVIITLFWTENIKQGIDDIVSWVAIPIMVLFLNIQRRNDKLKHVVVLKIFIYTMLFFCLFLFAISLRNIFNSDLNISVFLTKNVRFQLVGMSPISYHTPYLGLFLNFGLICLYFLRKKHLVTIGCSLLVGLVYLLMLYLNSNMNSFLSLILLILAVMFFELGRKKFLALFFLGIFAIASFSIIYKNEILRFNPAEGYWETPAYRIKRLLNNGDDTRIDTWKYSLDIISENVVFGVGTGDFVNLLQTYRDKDSYAYNANLNSHNQYLSIMGKYGLLGMFFFLLIIYSSVNNSVRSRDGFVLMVLFLICTMTSFMTENILERQWGISFFVFFNLIIYELNIQLKEKAI